MRMWKGMKSENHWQWHGEQRRRRSKGAQEVMCIDCVCERTRKRSTMFLINWKLLNKTTTANSLRAQQRIIAHAHIYTPGTIEVTSKQWDRRNANAVVDAPKKRVAASSSSTAHNTQRKIIDCAPHGPTCFVFPIYWNQYNFNLLRRTPSLWAAAAESEKCMCVPVGFIRFKCLVGAVGQIVCIATTRPKAKHSQEIQRFATQHHTTPNAMPCRAVLSHSLRAIGFFRSVLVLIILFFFVKSWFMTLNRM